MHHHVSNKRYMQIVNGRVLFEYIWIFRYKKEICVSPNTYDEILFINDNK